MDPQLDENLLNVELNLQIETLTTTANHTAFQNSQFFKLTKKNFAENRREKQGVR